ncbi:MAG: ABC transporter permease subunit [Thermofilaceae archaeon]
MTFLKVAGKADAALTVLYLLLCAALSTFRMFLAYLISLLISLTVGVWMARSRGVERVLLPVLDVLQSVPILGFFPAALAFFVATLPPGLGQEAAAVFLIVTSQVWNMIFGVYTSVKSLEPGLFEMAKVYGLGRAATFFYIYVPAAKNSLIANSLVSWAGGWFFLTSSEVISMGEEEHRLLGLGTFIMEAFERGDTLSFQAGVATLIAVILATYLLLWNPACAGILGYQLPGVPAAYAVVRSAVSKLWTALSSAIMSLRVGVSLPRYAGLAVAAVLLALLLHAVAGASASSAPAHGVPSDVFDVVLGFPVSLARVAAIVSLGVAISLLAAYAVYASAWTGQLVILAGEVLASIPAVIWWPLLAGIAVGSPLGPHIVSTIVFLQGSAWYLFFNLLIYGISSIRKELDEMAKVYRIRGWWFMRMIFAPMLMPSLAAGALSAWGGAWNSTIAAEYVELGDRVIDLGGAGAALCRAAYAGDYAGVALSALILSLVIVAVNKTFWRRVFEWVESRYGGGVE